jgi:peptide/nickel transport system substrate-binding protein
MRWSERGLRRLAVAAGTAVLALGGFAGCTGGGAPDPSPSTPGATPRPFTVMSTDQVRVTDPAAMTDAASASFALDVFQRLMTAAPGEDVLKPDAARDCLFTTATTYTCTLKRGLTFANGHPLTASDVKFSIQRALRLDVPGSSAPLLGSLRKVETPDDVTVRFLLSRPDTQFGWALASPAGSIVDEEVYDADKVQARDDLAVGSGPFTVTEFDEHQFSLAKFAPYQGFTPAHLDALVYRSVADSASVEDAMNKGQVDVVWRGLNTAAVTRLSSQVQSSADQQTSSGFVPQVLVGKRVLQLEWSPRSAARSNRGLRQAIAVALQGDRTLDSVVPSGVPGYASSFPLGGKATPKVTWKNRINLTLGYDSTAPNAQDLATQIRSRLEDTGGLSVRLRPDATDVDLMLTDRKAWTATALAWLQPYLDHPLPASASAVGATENAFRASTDATTSTRLLASLQRQAASDAVVLPISQSDEILWARAGVEVSAGSYGPGWQLGSWGISRG